MDIQRIKDAVQSTTPAPLHHKLRQAIYEQITDGTLQPGETLPSERAMKEHFGVSRATVRQAINSLIQEGLLQSVAGTGTFVMEPTVKASAASLVGLITSSPNFNFFYPQLTASFNQRIREAGYGLMMSLHSEHADMLDRMVSEMLEQNVVALAITPPRYGNMTPTLMRLRHLGVPVVLIGRNVATSGFDIVATDNESIGYQATRHLIDLGHRHIAHLGLLEYSTGDNRAAGYQTAMRNAGLQPHIYQLSEEAPPALDDHTNAPREHMAAPAQEAVKQIWKHMNSKDAPSTLPQPTAIFCFNDVVAMGAYKAIRELSLTIPDDVSIVSVDNLIAVRHFEVPLSTFALPGKEIGIRSAEILLRRMTGDSTPAETTLLPATFIPRASSAPLHDVLTR